MSTSDTNLDLCLAGDGRYVGHCRECDWWSRPDSDSEVVLAEATAHRSHLHVSAVAS